MRVRFRERTLSRIRMAALLEHVARGARRGETSEDLQYFVKNPFSGEDEIKYSKVLTRNKRKGETVLSPLLVIDLERQHE